jgi:hypothetical protein
MGIQSDIGNVGRSVVISNPDDYTTINAYVLVALLDCLHAGSVAISITNVDLANSVDWEVLTGNTDTITEAVVLKATAAVAPAGWGVYTSSTIAYRYVGVYARSTVGGAAGIARIYAIAKS